MTDSFGPQFTEKEDRPGMPVPSDVDFRDSQEYQLFVDAFGEDAGGYMTFDPLPLTRQTAAILAETASGSSFDFLEPAFLKQQQWATRSNALLAFFLGSHPHIDTTRIVGEDLVTPRDDQLTIVVGAHTGPIEMLLLGVMSSDADRVAVVADHNGPAAVANLVSEARGWRTDWLEVIDTSVMSRVLRLDARVPVIWAADTLSTDTKHPSRMLSGLSVRFQPILSSIAKRRPIRVVMGIPRWRSNPKFHCTVEFTSLRSWTLDTIDFQAIDFVCGEIEACPADWDGWRFVADSIRDSA